VDLGEIELGLLAGWGLEPDDRLGLGPRAHGGGYRSRARHGLQGIRSVGRRQAGPTPPLDHRASHR